MHEAEDSTSPVARGNQGSCLGWLGMASLALGVLTVALYSMWPAGEAKTDAIELIERSAERIPEVVEAVTPQASPPPPRELPPPEPIPTVGREGPIRSPVLACEDSDGGGKLFRRGTTTGMLKSGRTFVHQDRCLHGTLVVEYWCERGQLVEQVFDCLDPSFAAYRFTGCSGGSCTR